MLKCGDRKYVMWVGVFVARKNDLWTRRCDPEGKIQPRRLVEEEQAEQIREREREEKYETPTAPITSNQENPNPS